jgi:hypothetical protein
MPRTVDEINKALTVVTREYRLAKGLPADTAEEITKKMNTMLRLHLEWQQHLKDLYEMI